MNKPKYIDAHAHVNFPEYETDRGEVIKRSLDNQTWMVNVGTDKKTSQDVVDIANNYVEGIYAIIGLHPNHASDGERFDLNFYGELIKNPKVVGVGECGLDFFRLEGDEKEKVEKIKKQRQAFGVQIELAAENNKPLMIHCREAYPEVIQILKVYKLEYGDKLRGNFHFFSGTKEELQQILDLGFNISFTGVITFTNDYDELIKIVPMDRIMSETDCPFVAPVPHRGERNEPIYVSEVAKKIADIKGLGKEEVEAQLVENILKFYGLI